MSLPQLLMRRGDLADLPPQSVCEGVVVRPAVPADRDGIAACLATAFAEPWDAMRVDATLLSARDVLVTQVAEMGGRIAATASIQVLAESRGDVAILHWVASDPAVAGRGLGGRCSLAALHAAAGHGLVAAELLTDDQRGSAIRLYWRLGFRPFLNHRSHPSRWRAVREAFDLA